MRFNFLLIYLAAVNLISFLINCIDKYKATHDKWRIPEKTLWLFAVIGGAFGGYTAMKLVRHKTKHKSFMLGMPLLIVIQLAVIYLLLNQNSAIL